MDTPLTLALMSVLALPALEGAEVPDWIHLLPPGQVLTQDGRGPYSVPSLQAVIAASGGKLHIDENHAIDIAAPSGQPSRIVELQAREDGIWGRVEWTPSGRALMAERAYAGISPVIDHDKALRVHAIRRASLTNNPNLWGLTALHHQEHSMSLAARLAGLLGLDATTSEDTLVERITALHQRKDTTTALQTSLQHIGTVLGVAGAASTETIVAAAQAAGKTGTDLVPALQAENVTLRGRIDAIETERARERATAFVDGAKAAGHVGVTQANRDEFVSMHMANPASTEKLINGFPKMAGLQPQPQLETALQTVDQISAKARKYQAEQKAAGQDVSWTQAVMAVSEGAQ